jgi:hypothetical protein
MTVFFLLEERRLGSGHFPRVIWNAERLQCSALNESFMKRQEYYWLQNFLRMAFGDFRRLVADTSSSIWSLKWMSIHCGLGRLKRLVGLI